MPSAARQPLILVANPMWDRWPDLSILPADDAALVTFDRARFGEADMVVFHIPTIGLTKPWRLRKRPGQLWVAWSMESTANYPLLDDPRSAAAFDLTMTYERGADVWAPYLPPYFAERYGSPVPAKTEAAPVVMFQSSPYDRCGRIPYAAALMRSIRIDSYGAILNNRALVEADQGIRTKRSVMGRYKFCIAFENAISPDYVTEKFFDALLAGTVPVYRGAPDVAALAPAPDSYVDARAFGDPAALAAHLNALASDPAAYAALHRWRREPLPEGFRAHLAVIQRPAFARLAAIARQRPGIVRGRRGRWPRPLAHLEPPRSLSRRVVRWLADRVGRGT